MLGAFYTEVFGVVSMDVSVEFCFGLVSVYYFEVSIFSRHRFMEPRSFSSGLKF